MKKILAVLFAVALAFTLSVPSFALPIFPGPPADIQIKIQDKTGPPAFVTLPVQAKGPPGEFSFSNGNIPIVIPGKGRIDSIEVTIDQDPFITYGIAVIDFGQPSTFSFVFSTLIEKVSNPATVFASVSASVTEGSGGSVTITPAPPPAGIPQDSDLLDEMQVYTLSADGGASFTNAGVDVGPAFTIDLNRFASATYPAVNVGPVPGPAGGPWDFMRIDLNFTLSGGNDIATINGAVIIEELEPEASTTPIPEPSTFVLLSAGLLGFGLVVWRRKRQK